MATQFLRTALAGILAGVALFMLPFFLIRVFIFFCIIGMIFRLLGFRKRNKFYRMNPAYTERFANMNEEEKAAFRTKYGKRCGYYSTFQHDTTNNKQA